MKSSLRRPLGLPAAALLLAAAGCSAPDPSAGPAVPTPDARQAGHCRALHGALPDVLDGRKRRTAEPASDFTALWGDPAISLRCGVARPKILTRGSEHYNPNADSAELDGVEWLPERQPDGSVRCTTVHREAWIEVTLPARVVGGAGDISALTDLAGAITKTVPVGILP
ncbi:DUF3515 domain-containing protein [Streptomyces sp. L500]|uniref:DUF3515 domain-containing protein n=1 Tax=Streptomyces abikoensis TaxID=97398 RepID=UPI003698BB8F